MIYFKEDIVVVRLKHAWPTVDQLMISWRERNFVVVHSRADLATLFAYIEKKERNTTPQMETGIISELTHDLYDQILDYLPPASLTILSSSSATFRTQGERFFEDRDLWRSELVELSGVEDLDQLDVVKTYKELHVLVGNNPISTKGDLATALQKAAEGGYGDVVKLLLRHPLYSISILSRVVNASQDIPAEIVEMLMKGSELPRPIQIALLVMAILKDDIGLTEDIITWSNGSLNPSTALSISTRKGSYEMTRHFLDKYQHDSRSVSAYFVNAAEAGNTDAVRALLDSETVTIAKRELTRALEVVLSSGHEDVVDILLADGRVDASGIPNYILQETTMKTKIDAYNNRAY